MELNIFQEYWERFKRPWCISFTLYLIIVVVFLGGLGVVFSVFSPIPQIKVQHIASNAATYAIATLAPAIVSILVSFYKNDIKNKVSFAIILLTALVLSSILLYHTITSKGITSLVTATINIIIALFFWIIANYENEYLNDAAYDKTIKDETKRKHGGKWNGTK
jgi:hypothetical protein